MLLLLSVFGMMCLDKPQPVSEHLWPDSELVIELREFTGNRRFGLSKHLVLFVSSCAVEKLQ